MADPKIKIIGSKHDIPLYDFKFLNFRYIEDMNQGFPTIEFALRDNLFGLLREELFGDEELIIEEFEQDQFKFVGKSFRIKSIGSMGKEPKPATAQTVKIIAIDKNYDSILKNEKSLYFLPTEKKKISDLLNKLLTQVGIIKSTNFDIKIEPTAPLLEQGFGNLFIPYSRDPMKVMRKLCSYAATDDGTGSFVFFINRRGLKFVPVSQLFVDVTDKTPSIQITDSLSNYGINDFKLSTFNAFTNFVTGHEKKIIGFNLIEKDYDSISYRPDAKYKEHSEYIDKAEVASEHIKTMNLSTMINSNHIPFSTDFIRGNIKVYYTPLDNPKALKAYADGLYYAQMFNYILEIDVDMIQEMPDFAIGEMINIEFKTNDSDAWSTLNGGWLLKSFAYTYPSDNLILKLTRIGTGTLPTKYVTVGE